MGVAPLIVLFCQHKVQEFDWMVYGVHISACIKHDVLNAKWLITHKIFGNSQWIVIRLRNAWDMWHPFHFSSYAKCPFNDIFNWAPKTAFYLNIFADAVLYDNWSWLHLNCSKFRAHRMSYMQYFHWEFLCITKCSFFITNSMAIICSCRYHERPFKASYPV